MPRMNSEHRQIARAAGVVMAAFVVSRLFGVVRDMVIAAQLGTSDAADAYLRCFSHPRLDLSLIAGGALASAFIPTFADYLARMTTREGRGGSPPASSILLLVTTSVLAALAALFAPPLAWALAPGFGPEKQALTVSLVRVMLICPVIFGVSGLMHGDSQCAATVLVAGAGAFGV